MPIAREWICADLKPFFGSPHRKVILDAARRKKLKVKRISEALTSISSDLKHHVFHEHVPDTLSYVAHRISSSKILALNALNLSGVRTPKGKLFVRSAIEDAWAYAESIGLPVVIKPNAGSGGEGVVSNITSKSHFEAAWNTSSKAKKIIVEKHISGEDHRLLVVGNSLVCAMRRDPAHVVGDGMSTIQELVAKKDEDRRSNPYLAGKKFILTSDMLYRLAANDLKPESILNKGRYLQLHPIANVGAGGESVDVTETVHPEFSRFAVQACRSIPTMIFSGIDLIAEDITRHPDEQDWAVIETNCTPDIALHHFPSHGTPRDAAGALLDYLFSGSAQ